MELVRFHSYLVMYADSLKRFLLSISSFCLVLCVCVGYSYFVFKSEGGLLFHPCTLYWSSKETPLLQTRLRASALFSYSNTLKGCRRAFIAACYDFVGYCCHRLRARQYSGISKPPVSLWVIISATRGNTGELQSSLLEKRGRQHTKS